MNSKDENIKNEKKKRAVIDSFPVPFSLGEVKDNINTNIIFISSKEEILEEATKFHAEGDVDEAIKYYEFFLDQGYNDPRVFSNLGIILRQRGKIDKAITLYNKSINLFPNSPEAYANLGNLLNDLGNPKQAELFQRKAIELRPNIGVYHFNLGNTLTDLGQLEQAELSLRRAIELKHNFAEAYYNLGKILKKNGKLKEAEICQRNAIKFKQDFSDAYISLGFILKELGQLEEAEISFLQAIDINPNEAHYYLNIGNLYKDFGKLKESEFYALKTLEIKFDCAKAYLLLSILNFSNKNTWKEKLFSESIIQNMSQSEIVDIYFARANILHNEKRYKKSAKYLKLANQIKLKNKPLRANSLLTRSNLLNIDLRENSDLSKETRRSSESIFIVGMPRSGSTLVENIISTNKEVRALGEVNFLEDSLLDWIRYEKNNQRITIAELYLNKTNYIINKSTITTNKWLYNYEYIDCIVGHIPNSKIIHCFRNPLDNILSIYRAHFANGNEYSSSLVDCAKVYLDYEEKMNKFKKNYSTYIYDLNYDKLVSNPSQEVKSLINWLGWEWKSSYLSPHLNSRSISTASSVKARFPINAKSIGGWKNYKDMLMPAIDILKKSEKYKNHKFS
tara:strand:+ start:5007 stop:6869 length:1863 start_codon:yes stop_codon:yes gene_type:complete